MSRVTGSPEHVLVPAGVVTRVLAAVIDLLVVVGLTAAALGAVAAGAFLISPVSFRWPAGLAAQASVAALAVGIIYLTAGWAIAGWTVGGAVLGVRVVAVDGSGLGWLRSAARAVLCVVVPLGLLWTAVSLRRRSFQDLVVRSAVVYDGPGPPADAPPGSR